MSEALKVTDGLVISRDYPLKVDEKIVDTSEGHLPIEFIQDVGNIIPGLEREVYGLAIGDTKNVTVKAKDGYGEFDQEAFMDVPRHEFPTEIPLEIGTQLERHGQHGRPMHASIAQVGDETVKLDFNHPMAGKELHFFVNIAGPVQQQNKNWSMVTFTETGMINGYKKRAILDRPFLVLKMRFILLRAQIFVIDPTCVRVSMHRWFRFPRHAYTSS